jgi:choline kinase
VKALIFNSGIGKRMGALTKNRPKCMVDIGSGHTIVSWQLKALADIGVRDVIMTTGPFEKRLKDYIAGLGYDVDVQFVHNQEYDITNYIYSMQCASPYLDDDLILLHGDLLFEPSVLRDLIRSEKSVITVDSNLPLPEKDFKAYIQDGQVKAIGVDLFGQDCIACQPAYKILYNDLLKWLEKVNDFCTEGLKSVYAENALNQCTDKLMLYPLELSSRLCNEIDNETDLEYVSRRFASILEKGN